MPYIESINAVEYNKKELKASSKFDGASDSLHASIREGRVYMDEKDAAEEKDFSSSRNSLSQMRNRNLYALSTAENWIKKCDCEPGKFLKTKNSTSFESTPFNVLKCFFKAAPNKVSAFNDLNDLDVKFRFERTYRDWLGQGNVKNLNI